MLILRKRLTFVAGAVTLALLALPSLASARPGLGPELVQRSGRLVIVHGDRPDGTAARQWTLVRGTTHIPVRLPGDVWVDPGTPVQLEGTMQNGALVVSDSVSAVTEEGPSPLAAQAPATAAAPLVHSTAVILVGFTGGPAWTAANPTNADAAGLMFGDPATRPDSLNSYYLEQTYGQVAFGGNVFGPVTINPGPLNPTTGCGNSDVYAWAQQAEAAAGVSDFAYQHYVFVFPTIAACAWSGQAEIGGRYVWVNGVFQVRVLAHELGHNLGLAHAGGLGCVSAGTPVSIGGTCDQSSYPNGQYGDPFDPMGRSESGGGYQSVRQMSMQHKLKLQLLPASAVKVVGASGPYHLSPMETLTGSVELLRIPKLGGGSYYVEYRWPIGFFDTQLPVLQGVLVRTDAPASADPNSPDTSLVDMHPATSPDWTDAAMVVGQVFSDPLAGVTIQNLGQDATGATLLLNVPRDTRPPSAPGRLTAVANGTAAVLSWTAASDDYSVDAYRVTRDGALIGTPAGTDFTDSGLVPGATVAYTVAAVDAGGNVGPVAPASLQIPDAVAPGAPPRVTARVSKDGNVHIAWGAAADNGRVAGYRVLRNGSQIASGNGLAFVDKSARPGSGATVTYSVLAVDLANNLGPAGKARPLRAALLRKLGASGLKVTRRQVGARTLVRVKGRLSDARARCRLRIGGASWHACKTRPNGAFDVSLPARGLTPVTLSLKDQLGRVKLQTLRVR